MVVVDLNSDIDFGQKTFTKNRKGLANVYWTNCFLATIGLCISNGTTHNLSLAFWKKDRNSDCWERI